MASSDLKAFELFLDPNNTRANLIAASVYVAGFEVLKESIVGKIRDFFCFGFDESGFTIDPTYQDEVLSRNRSPVYASFDWLKENGALNDRDVDIFGSIKACRNKLAHELLPLLVRNQLPADFEDCFRRMVELIRKIELWWITDIEIPLNPDMDLSDIDEDEILPGTVALITMLLNIAFGDEETSGVYLKEFRRQT